MDLMVFSVVFYLLLLLLIERCVTIDLSLVVEYRPNEERCWNDTVVWCELFLEKLFLLRCSKSLIAVLYLGSLHAHRNGLKAQLAWKRTKKSLKTHKRAARCFSQAEQSGRICIIRNQGKVHIRNTANMTPIVFVTFLSRSIDLAVTNCMALRLWRHRVCLRRERITLKNIITDTTTATSMWRQKRMFLM